MISGVLLDLAGVIYDGEKVIPGATDAVARLREVGLPIRFVSNTNAQTSRLFLIGLMGLGFP
jgi:ribonucleotide monophosphatase NagD (HAD superfamily)